MTSQMSSPTQSDLQTGIRAPQYRLPSASRIGRVRLAVSDLKSSVAFYTAVIGLTVVAASEGEDPTLVKLGIQGGAEVLLELQAIPGVRPIGQRTRLGLYHTAFLLPSREALSSFIQHLTTHGVRFGSSDHRYSEALYLTDPDGLSVEVYADRPREEWTYEGQELLTGVYPLQFSALPRVEKGAWTGAPLGTTIGHIHLYVGDLESAKSFYHRAMGLDLMTWRYPGALFTSAGGYHHHVGLNVWAAGSPPAAENDARILFWELVLPRDDDADEVEASFTRSGYAVRRSSIGRRSITDPWGIKVVLVTGAKT